MVEPLEHLCDVTGDWEPNISCEACSVTPDRSFKDAPRFNIKRLQVWNNYGGAGGMTGNEYVKDVMDQARAAGKKPHEMPVPKKRWI